MTSRKHARDGAATDSDAALMLRASRGDVAAFAQIYDRHAATVLALTRRMLGSSGDAQDLLHDVFLEAWLAVRDYDPRRASVAVWLLVRARSRALDRHGRSTRQRTLQAALGELEATANQSTGQPDPERRIAVRQALSTLPGDVRQTLELTFFEGLTATEAAARMSVPEGTVKSRLARGLEIMQRIFRMLEERQP